MGLRVACALAAAAVLMLTGCGAGSARAPTSGAPTSGAPSILPTSSPTDALSDSTAYFRVEVTGRAHVRWTDGTRVNTEVVEAGTHRYGTDSWEAGALSAVTVVPLGDKSTASCTAQTSDPTPKLPASDDASGPEDVAVCWAAHAVYQGQPGRRRLVELAATSSGGQHDVVARTPGRISYDVGVSGTSRLRATATGYAMTIVVSRSSNDTIGCTISLAGKRKAARSTQGFGAIAVCYIDVK